MMLKYLSNMITALVFSAVLFIALAQAEPFTLKSLNQPAITQDVIANGLATITMIYQPDCSWCKKQGQFLAKAFTQCHSSLNVALIGAKGNIRALKNALKHYHHEIPAYAADSRFLRSIGGYQASPTTLIYDSKGKLIAKKRGFIPQDKLADVLAIISQGSCQI